MKKRLSTFRISVILLLLLLMGTVLWITMLRDAIPHSRRHFRSYGNFKVFADGLIFPSAIPKQAEAQKYYWYNGWGDKIRGVNIRFSGQDYQTWKESCQSVLLNYARDTAGTVYQFEGTGYNYVDPNTLGNEALGFLEELMTKPEGLDYYYLSTWEQHGENLRVGMGIICNDTLRELILYDFKIYNASQLYERPH